MAKAVHSLFDRNPLIMGILTWTVRICIGVLFIFSGMTKGIDVWGTIFKFKEYFGAMGYEVWDALNLSGVFLLCLLEFLVGFFILFGCFRRTAPIVAALIMLFMLPLTLWLAVANPIADCGCFGDALKLTNWQTFWKNVVISVGVVWLIFYNRRIGWLITPYLQWIAGVLAGLYFLAIALIGYYYQPLIDFRPYKTGTPLVEAEEDTGSDEEDDMVFVYEKNGEKKEFRADDALPDEADGWTFVERRFLEPEEIEAKADRPAAAKAPSEKNIRFYTTDGREDVTPDVIGHGRQLILFIPKLSEVAAAKTWKINSLYQWAEANGIEMLAAVGGNPSEITQWEDISMAEYPIYTSDDTAIEEVVRGNPAVVYLEDGVVKWKSSLKAIDIDDFQKPEINSDPMAFARDDLRIFRNITWIFIAAVAVLIFLSFFAEGLLAWAKASKLNALKRRRKEIRMQKEREKRDKKKDKEEKEKSDKTDE